MCLPARTALRLGSSLTSENAAPTGELAGSSGEREHAAPAMHFEVTPLIPREIGALSLALSVVDPQISFTFDPEMPLAGEPFTATCSVSVSPDLSGTIQLQWRNERGEVIEVGSGNTTAEISFTIERFSMADSTVIGGFNCRAAISAADETRNYNIVIGRNILFTCESPHTSHLTPHSLTNRLESLIMKALKC